MTVNSWQQSGSRLLLLPIWSWYVLAFAFSLRSIALAEAPVAVTAATILAVAYLLHLLLNRHATTWINRISTAHSVVFLSAIIAISFILRAAWGMWVQTEPYSDFEVYHQAALSLSRGESPIPGKPLGYPLILAIWYRLGQEKLARIFLNALLGTGTVLIVYHLGYIVTGKRLNARVAALLMAFWPADILYSSVLGSEAAYALFLWLAYLLFLSALSAADQSPRSRIVLILVSGLILAFSNTIRPTSLPLVLPVLVLSLFTGNRLRERLRIVLALLFVFLTVLSSQVLIQTASILTSGTVAMPSQRWGYNFLIGTNTETWGRYNESDVNLISALPGNELQRNQAALQLGLQRIRNSPAAFLALLPKKFIVLWGDDTYGAFSTGSTGRIIPSSAVGYLNYVSQVYWCLVVLLLGLVYIWPLDRSFSPNLQCLLVLLLLSTFFFELWEVQPRYHHFLNPTLAIFAAMGVTTASKKERTKVMG